MAKRGERPVKIFATDVHRGSLEHATRAIYTEEALAGVSVSDDEYERVLDIQWRPEPAGKAYDVALPQSEIAAPVGKVAAALLSWAGDENARASLPGWGDPA